MITAGIDAGSRAIKVVLVESDDLSIVASGITDQGIQQDKLAVDLLHDVMEKAGVNKEHLGPLIATGYGRDSIDIATETVTEITCHAKGVRHLQPECMTVIDIGGQDSKLIRMRPDGHIRDFVMNDRCAAGTGRFLEVVAERLKLELNELGSTAAQADAPSPISSMCVVFAETEITGLLAAGEKQSNIVAGVQASIASRLTSMAGRNIEEPIVFTGGVAMITGMKDALETTLKHPISLVSDPQLTGALGAALLAGEIVL
jgi:predicted CoA-substrate-specific enzyme activase